MAVQTDQVRELVDFSPEGFLVTSFYLDVNAGEFPDPDHINKSVDSALHTANMQREALEENLSHEAKQSLRDDLARIEEFVKNEFDRQDANGVAIFSCSGAHFWEIVKIPTQIETEVFFAPRPYVVPLAAFLSHSKPTAILLTDRQTARIFTMSHGESREWTDFTDYVPARQSQGGWSQMRYQRRSDNFAKHHVDHAAELVLRLLQHYPFDWLILADEVDTKNDVDSGLHPYVKDRVIGRMTVRIDADASEVFEKARDVREEAETNHINNLVNQIQEYAGAGGRGTIGLKPTIDAMNEQRIHILLVQQSFQHPGAVCSNCGFITLDDTGTCPSCGEKTEQREDVVEALLQRAFELGSVVEVATEYQQLEPIQNIGSILYY